MGELQQNSSNIIQKRTHHLHPTVSQISVGKKEFTVYSLKVASYLQKKKIMLVLKISPNRRRAKSQS